MVGEHCWHGSASGLTQPGPWIVGQDETRTCCRCDNHSRWSARKVKPAGHGPFAPQTTEHFWDGAEKDCTADPHSWTREHPEAAPV